MTMRDKLADHATTQPVDADLLIAPSCAHCPGVMDSLGKLVKEGAIGRLTVTNLASHPEAAAQAGTRSVPWIRIGPYELEGAHSPAELRDWAHQAAAGAGMAGYLAYLLEHQRLPRAVALVSDNPLLLHELVPLVADLATPMAVRIGIGALFEEAQEQGQLVEILHELGALTRSPQQQTRADACHYLGLTESPEAIDYVRPLLDDADAEVREIAAESLALVTPPAD